MEAADALSEKKGLFAYAFVGRDITGRSVEDVVYEVQRKVILDLAEKETCVIVGRNGDIEKNGCRKNVVKSRKSL